MVLTLNLTYLTQVSFFFFFSNFSATAILGLHNVGYFPATLASRCQQVSFPHFVCKNVKCQKYLASAKRTTTFMNPTSNAHLYSQNFGGRLRQARNCKGDCKLQASLGYIVLPCLKQKIKIESCVDKTNKTLLRLMFSKHTISS